MICEEFINILAASLHSKIVAETKDEKYVCVGSTGFTPDIAHIHQLNIIIRYCTNSSQIVERFLGFISVEFHDE
jgi:hypothetical protein